MTTSGRSDPRRATGGSAVAALDGPQRVDHQGGQVVPRGIDRAVHRDDDDHAGGGVVDVQRAETVGLAFVGPDRARLGCSAVPRSARYCSSWARNACVDAVSPALSVGAAVAVVVPIPSTTAASSGAISRIRQFPIRHSLSARQGAGDGHTTEIRFTGGSRGRGSGRRRPAFPCLRSRSRRPLSGAGRFAFPRSISERFAPGFVTRRAPAAGTGPGRARS